MLNPQYRHDCYRITAADMANDAPDGRIIMCSSGRVVSLAQVDQDEYRKTTCQSSSPSLGHDRDKPRDPALPNGLD